MVWTWSCGAWLYSIQRACPDGQDVQSVATDYSLSLIAVWARILAGACDQVASDLVLGGGFTGYSGFLHYLQLASEEA